MNWDKPPPQHSHAPPLQLPVDELNGGGRMVVKVMTDEQIEDLRKQIAVYASICEQLVDMHKSLTSQHDLAGVRLGNLYCDPLGTSIGPKITGRQRWTPTPVQLQILEGIFDRGNGAPARDKVGEITAELSQHGQITKSNVYNWFQNRRARSKRKQQIAGSNNVESEVETEEESPNDKNTKPEDMQSSLVQTTTADNTCFQNPETRMHSTDLRASKPEPILHSEGSSRPAENFNQMSYYGRIDQMLGKIDMPGSFNPYIQPEDYNFNMTG